MKADEKIGNFFELYSAVESLINLTNNFFYCKCILREINNQAYLSYCTSENLSALRNISVVIVWG